MMKQISFKLPEPEYIFLQWYSQKFGQPISSIYRNITLDTFRQWKIRVLLDEYKQGSIGLKKLCKLGNLSFSECILLLEKNGVEPPITKLMDQQSSFIRDNLLPEDVFKQKALIKKKKAKIDKRNINKT